MANVALDVEHGAHDDRDRQDDRHKHNDAREGHTAAPQAAGASGMSEWFHRFAHHVSNIVGSPITFACAVVLILVWAALGPAMKYSTTWQLIVNTGTTIATFLMVFLVQNTQNRDARAIHLKLDELIRAKKGARNAVIDLESCTDDELVALEAEFKKLRERGAAAAEREAHAEERAAEAKERKAEAEEREAHAEVRKAQVTTRQPA